MTPFNADATCPKCGCDKIHARWKEPARSRDILADGDGDKDNSEHIRRCCSRCGYSWNEAPIDAEVMPERLVPDNIKAQRSAFKRETEGLYIMSIPPDEETTE